MSKRSLTAWVAVLGLMCAMPVILAGCSAHGFDPQSLINSFERRGEGAMDGFVFVPLRSRQSAGGQAIPHAQIRVFQLPRQPGDEPLVTTQADENGFYRVENMPLNVPIFVEATEPFTFPGDPVRVLAAVISFSSDAEDKTRNLTAASTVAAALIEQQEDPQPLSDAQVSALEEVALASIPEGVDPTIDPAALTQIVEEVQVVAFGTIVVRVFTATPTTAAVLINGAQVGTVNTSVPGGSTQELVLDNQPIGELRVTIRATGYLDAVATVLIQGGQTSVIGRTLVLAPQPAVNQPPTLIDVRVDPPFLPFNGGQVTVQALAQDTENDALTLRATIRRAAEDSSTPPLLADIPLQHVDGMLFSGQATIPGNPSIVAATYVVTITAVDSPQRPPVTRVLNFQVAGVHAPPPPPDSGSTATD